MAKASTAPEQKRWHVWAMLGFVTLLSFLTFFHRYWQPPYVFWDENYHIASAQKYIHGVYFMEQHPPLGKLLIALGEVMFHPNQKSDQFLGTDYGSDFPEGFSFAGYRFFPALLSWWTAPLLFCVFYLLTKRNALLSCIFSFLYIFDNAMVVHFRGAMLDGPLLFFSTLTILAFLLLLQKKYSLRNFILLSIFFGTALALVMTTKVVGLVLILLIPALLWKLWPYIDRILGFLAVAGVSFLIIYCSIWYIHFSLGRTINPSLPDQGYYQASESYKRILAANKTSSLLAFPVMLRDSLKFVGHYNAGAPRLDLCKKDENGSSAFFWPLGARSINYRWETPGLAEGQAPETQVYKYLYLQANPVVWWASFAGVLLGFAMLLSHVFFAPKKPLEQKFLLTVFLAVYASYMIAISRIDRVMYLYHYFLPLLLSFLILAIVIQEIQTIGKYQITASARTTGVMIFGLLVFFSFQFYRPLTYYEPMTDAQVMRRAIFQPWELHCVNCDQNSPLVVPSKEP